MKQSKDSKGKTDNFNNDSFKSFVKNILEQKNYTYIPHKKFKPSTYLEQPLYTTDYYIGKGIYETKTYCDFVLYHPKKFPELLGIECKWQQSGGTVDEKFPYFILNIQQKFSFKAIFLLDGQGYRPEAEAWVKKQIGNNLLHVFNMSEFQKWVNRGNI